MSTPEQILDIAAEVAYQLSALFDALIDWRNRPVKITVEINGKATGMATQIPDDQTFKIHVAAFDKFGDPATDTQAFNITSSNPSMCTIEPDPDHPGDSAWAVGTPAAGSGQFVINATDGTLKGASDELDIVPGAPAVLQVEINAS